MKHLFSILVIVAFYIVYPWNVLKTDDYYRIRQIREHKYYSDSVIIGDSRLRNLNLPGYENLAIAGIGLPEVFYVTRDIIEHRTGLKKIVFCIDPEHFFLYNHFETIQRDRFYTDDFSKELQSTAQILHDHLYIVPRRSFLDEIRFRFLTAEFTTRIRNPVYLIKDISQYYFNNTDYSCHSEKNPQKRQPDQRAWQTISPSPVNNLYGKKLFDLLNGHPEISVTWVIPQRCGKYNSELLPVYKSWLTFMGAESVNWINMADWVKDEDFFDQKHLRCDGLQKIAAQLR